MNRFKGPVILTMLFGALAVTGILTSSRDAVAQNPSPGSAPVNIVSPLPLPVTGSVGFTPGSSVEISNPATQPVLVRDVDGEGSREIVSRQIDVNLGGGGGSCGADLDVPAGRRLVIEHLSAREFIPVPARLISIGLRRVSAPELFVTAVPFSQGTVGNFNVAVASQQMHIYSDEPVEPCVQVSANLNGSVTVMISGYLIDRP